MKKETKKSGSFLNGLFAEYCILTLGLFILEGSKYKATEVLAAGLILLFIIRFVIYFKPEK